MKSAAQLLGLFLALPAYATLSFYQPSCSTLVGPRKPNGSLPTSTKTFIHTYSWTQTVTTKPTVTYTPTYTTTTTSELCVKTVTLKKKERPTAYVTKTKYSTVDTTTSIVETITSTQTYTTSPHPYTTTVPTPHGYKPIQSGSIKYLPGDNIELTLVERATPQQTASVDSNGKVQWYPPVYPTKVVCTVTAMTTAITTTTVRGSNTCTVTAYPAATETQVVTKQYTSTTTKYTVNGKTKTSRIFTTSTITDVETSTSTAYETETTTFTAPAPPSATEYAVCKDDNFASHYQKGTKDLAVCAVSYDKSYSVAFADYETAKDCCNLCAGSEGCAGSIWSQADRSCVLVSGNGSCSPERYFFYGIAEKGAKEDKRFLLSNGPCGRGAIKG